MHLGAFSLDAFYDEAPTMVNNDVVTEAQPQTRAKTSGFGRKERLHHFMEYSGGDANSVILKRHADVRTPIYGDLFSQNGQDFPRVRTWIFQVQCIARIVNNIQKNLLNLLT